MKDRVAGAPGRYSAVVSGEELQNLQTGNPFTITLTRDDQPIEPGTPYSKAAILPDDVAKSICPEIADPTPADAFRAIDGYVSKFFEDLQIERNRIDNIASLPEGSTSGDAELQDIRVGYDGTTYDSAGSAVRGQVQDLHKITDRIQLQEFDLNEDATEKGYIDSDNVTFVSSSTFRTTKPLFVKENTRIKYKLLHGSNKLPQIVLYSDKDATSVVTIDGSPAVVMGKRTVQEGEYVVPANGYIRLVNYTTLTDGYVIFVDEIPDNVRIYVAEILTESKEYTDEKEQISRSYTDQRTNNADRMLFSVYNNTQNGYLTQGGAFVANEKLRTTDPLFVKEGTKVKFRLKRGTNNEPIIGLYGNKELTNNINFVIGGTEAIEGEYTVPSDGYIRFVNRYDYTDGYVIFDNSIADSVRMQLEKTPDETNPNMKILVMGDSIMGTDGEIVQYLSQLTHATVINGAFGGTRVVARAENDTVVPALRAFDGENLISALTSGNWDAQNAAAAELGYSWITNDRLPTIQSINTNDVDLVILGWGTNDYAAGNAKQEILDAYGTVIDTLQSTLPELRILITTPIWRYFDSEMNSDNKVYNDATLKEIAEAIENFAKEKRISVLNSYQNMPLSYNTVSTYFDDDDGVHLNAKGNMVYAHLLNGKIRSMY